MGRCGRRAAEGVRDGLKGGARRDVWFCKAICMVLQCERYGFARQKVTYGAREGQEYQAIALRGGGGGCDGRGQNGETLWAEEYVKFSVLFRYMLDYQQTNII